jgi:hypothetical protein
MSCGKCKRRYEYELVIPLTCRCGFTLCKACAYSNSSGSLFRCSNCSATIDVNQMIVNRSLDGVNSEMMFIHRKAQQFKPTKLSINALSQDINSSVPYVYMSDYAILTNDQSVEAIPEFTTISTQSAESFILTEKLCGRKISADIKWSKCFIVPLYFIFVIPWVFTIQLFIAYIGGENKGECNSYL